MTPSEHKDEELSGLAELDRLVLEALASFGGDVEATKRQPQSAKTGANVIFSKQWAQTPEPASTELEGAENFSAEPADEEGVEELADSLMEEFQRTDPERGSEYQGVLSAEETEFVSRIVKWLERRSNRDVILNEIWRRILPPDDTETAQKVPDAQQPEGSQPAPSEGPESEGPE